MWNLQSEPAEQDQHEEDDRHHTQDAHRAVSIAVAIAAAEAREAAQQGDDENDEKDCSERHCEVPFLRGGRARATRARLGAYGVVLCGLMMRPLRSIRLPSSS